MPGAVNNAASIMRPNAVEVSNTSILRTPENRPVRGTTNAAADARPNERLQTAHKPAAIASLRAPETGKGDVIDVVG